MLKFNIYVSLADTKPMLSPYQGTSTGIYLFWSSSNSPMDRHKSSPTSLQDQSNLYHVQSLDYTVDGYGKNMAKLTDTFMSFPCAMKGAQHFTLLKFAPMELVNYS